MKTNRYLSMSSSLAMLAGAILCAGLESVSAAPNTQRPIVVGPIYKGSTKLPPARNMLSGPPIPLMTDMLGYARTGIIGSRIKTAVHATVTIASPGSGSKAGSAKTSYANGVLKLAGTKGDERLEGSFPLAQNSGDAAAPFQGARGTFLKVRILQNGHVTLTTSVPLKKFSETTTFKSDGTDGYLWGRATSGSARLISISLSKGTAPTGRTVPVPPRPPATPPPPPPPPPPPSGPRGMRVRIGGEIRVTNSDDGVMDGTVEMFGEIYFNGNERWRIKRSSAQDRKKDHVELLDFMNVDVYFNDASTQMLKVTGTLRDRDIKGGDTIIRGDDDMWNVVPRDNTIMVDLKQMVESGTTRKTLYGDNDSENANVVITVRKISDIN